MYSFIFTCFYIVLSQVCLILMIIMIISGEMACYINTRKPLNIKNLKRIKILNILSVYTVNENMFLL